MAVIGGSWVTTSWVAADGGWVVGSWGAAIVRGGGNPNRVRVRNLKRRREDERKRTGMFKLRYRR